MKTIYPTGEAYIPGVPAIEQEVSDERADELLAYSPAAFTLDKDRGVVETQTYVSQSTQFVQEESAPERSTKAPREPKGSKE